MLTANGVMRIVVADYNYIDRNGGRSPEQVYSDHLRQFDLYMVREQEKQSEGLKDESEDNIE